MPKLEIKWQEPLEFAQRISANFDKNWVFLYSGLSEKIKKSVSIIALFEKEKIVGNDFLEAEKIIKSANKKWLGYLSYELGQDFETLPKTKKSIIDLPKIYLMNFALILKFDHDKKKLTAIFDNKNNLEQILKWSPSLEKSNIAIKNWSSNFTNESYINAISDIKKQIAAGDFYQTNLTRKFFGEFQQKQNHQSNFQLFTKLTELSPANYSAFLKIDENYIISSSPELFLKAKNNHILSRPIKGTAPRDKDLKQDEKNKLNLKNSLKERAENLMIVDLVRNDLARVCQAGSVVVKKLFDVTSYQNIHHMSSEIHGKIAQNLSAFDTIKSCFPAGSMTGAPKIKAMEIVAKKEKLNRGIYSGSIGLFSKNEINSSVVIRTLILQENKFEFQVGGAITFDSDPKAELEETFNKAKGITGLLQVDVKS
jgi:para-aminobenzoate synthetase component 1